MQPQITAADIVQPGSIVEFVVPREAYDQLTDDQRRFTIDDDVYIVTCEA